MKKRIAILIFTGMVLGLMACGNKTEQTVREEISVENTAEGDTIATEDNTVINDSIDNSEDVDDTLTENGTDEMAEIAHSDENGNDTEAQGDTETQDDTKEQGAKVLVAYFSATNTTKGVAEHIANGLNADLYEITPTEPYTDADLDYSDNNSRSTIEMDDPASRPAISDSVENMSQYDVVFVGFPIWWGEAPRIMSTFVESYDLSGKIIVPFCTSGSSGVGSSATSLEQLTSGAQWLAGTRLNGSASQDEIMEWVNGLGLDLGE